MELTQLRYFLEVASTEHVTRSAENLHIAQPALTQAMHRLEDEIGVPLFAHKGRGIVLTQYGQYLYKKLRPAMTEIESLPAQLRSMAQLEDSVIHLNVLAASSLVMDAVADYQRIDDSLHFQLKQNEQSDLYDICVTTKLFYQHSEREEDSLFVCTEKIYLAVPNIEKFRGKNSISLKEVGDEDFISLLGSRQLRSICDKYCAASGIKPNIVFESDNPAAVRNMIAANMGVGFWPAFSWGQLNTRNVLMLDIVDPVCSRDILITYRKNKQDDFRVRKFYNHLTDTFRTAAR